MSDFDKEAEREKLREKYEQDKQKREATEQMSELLLQGATMTNAHCSDCGDPVFRYDGQEFCPTCEKAVDRGESEDDQNGIEVTETSETAVAFGGAAEDTQDGGDHDPAQSERQTRQHADQQPRQQSPQEPSDPAERRPREHTNQVSRGRSPREQTTASPEDGVPAAREALVEALVQFSERAAVTDDPRRAQDSLAAAREAAEALSALDR